MYFWLTICGGTCNDVDTFTIMYFWLTICGGTCNDVDTFTVMYFWRQSATVQRFARAGEGVGETGGRNGRVGLSESRSGRIVASHGCADHQSILASLRRLIDRNRQEREMAATCRAGRSFYVSPSVVQGQEFKTVWLGQLFRSDNKNVSLAGTATSIIFVATKVCLSRQNFWRNKFATNIILWHVFVVTKRLFSLQKYAFRDKTFVKTKLILVAAPANEKKKREKREKVSTQFNTKDWMTVSYKKQQPQTPEWLIQTQKGSKERLFIILHIVCPCHNK